MAEEAVWTRQQRENTLAGIALLREAHGLEHVAEDAERAIQDALRKYDDPSPIYLGRLLSGMTNTAGMLLDWIESEAQNKQILLDRVRQSLPDFEEPDSYPTSPKFPNWSSWTGVLLTIEKTARESAVTD